MENEMMNHSLYERFMKGEETLSHEDLQTLLWSKWITTLEFVESSDRYKEEWQKYCHEKGLDFPREIHAQDFIAMQLREV